MQPADRRSLVALSLAVVVAVALYLSGRTLVATWNFRLLHSKERPNSRLEFKLGSTESMGLEGSHSVTVRKLFLEVPQIILTSESKLVHARFEEKFVSNRKAVDRL